MPTLPPPTQRQIQTQIDPFQDSLKKEIEDDWETAYSRDEPFASSSGGGATGKPQTEQQQNARLWSEANTNPTPSSSSSSAYSLHLTSNTSGGTPRFALLPPPTAAPKLTILKRPTNLINERKVFTSSTDSRSREERELDYQVARERIYASGGGGSGSGSGSESKTSSMRNQGSTTTSTSKIKDPPPHPSHSNGNSQGGKRRESTPNPTSSNNTSSRNTSRNNSRTTSRSSTPIPISTTNSHSSTPLDSLKTTLDHLSLIPSSVSSKVVTGRKLEVAGINKGGAGGGGVEVIRNPRGPSSSTSSNGTGAGAGAGSGGFSRKAVG